MYTSVVSSYVICSDNIVERTINEFSSSGVSPYVSYRQGDQPCLNLCEKPRRQPYVTYVAYVLMSTAVSGTRAKPETAYFPDAGRVAPIRASVWR